MDASKMHMGTLDYVAQRYYKRLENQYGKDADVRLQKYYRFEQKDKSGPTKWLGESARFTVGAYVVEECGFAPGGRYVYFCTFDHNSLVLKYDSIGVEGSYSETPSVRLVSKLSLGPYGGHYTSAAAFVSDFGFFGTAGAPARILTVALKSTPLSVVASETLDSDYGGIFALAIDDAQLLAILGKPPVRIAHFNVSATGHVKLVSVLQVSDGDEAACPSSSFIDRVSKTALVATRGGCVHRVSYRDGVLQVSNVWDKVCSTTASNFRRLAVADSGRIAVIGSFFPIRQLLLLDMATGVFVDAMQLPNRDVAFVTNIMSKNNGDVFVVGNSQRGVPVVMQLDLSNQDKLHGNWGVIAAGHCDQYSWTEGKKKLIIEGSVKRFWPTRLHGCVWMPKGRVATGAVLSNDGRLFIAAKAQRCTVCTETETEFDNGRTPFCIEEFEDFRAPAAICGQHAQNIRPFVRERSLDIAQLQRETNSLAGGENLTVIEFQLGTIPLKGAIHGPMMRSFGRRTSEPWILLTGSLLALGAASSWPSRHIARFATISVFAWLAIALPKADALTKPFHAQEHDCKCLLGCKILGEDSGDCNDQSDNNAHLFEARFASVPDDDSSMCDLLQCMAYCGGPMEKGTQMFGRSEELLCSSLAKQINCAMDCSGAYRNVLPALPLIISLLIPTLLFWHFEP
jgi:hypothetical protein